MHRLINGRAFGRGLSQTVARVPTRTRSTGLRSHQSARFTSTLPSQPQNQGRTLKQRVWRRIKIAAGVAIVSVVALSYMAEFVERQITKKFLQIVTSLVQLEDSSGQIKCSGFLIDLDGFIVTHASIIKGGEKSVKVTLMFGTEHLGEVCGVDDETQSAVVKVNADLKVETGLPKFFEQWAPIPLFIFPAAIGKSAKLNKGSYVGVLGACLSEDGSLGVGEVVTTTRRPTDLGTSAHDLIETNHAFFASNVGGPLMNIFGQVVGINTIVLDPEAREGNKEGSGHSFAIPIDAAWPGIQRIVKTAREKG